jgi:hypothetical protein
MKEIILTQRKIALVDDEDYEYLAQWKWRAVKGTSTWYAVRGKEGIRIHREIMKTPPELVVDHKDWNGLIAKSII